jgi:iron-sulfur cluster assembly protein
MNEPVSISDHAAREIRYILEKKNIPKGYGLRVGIKGGRGCAAVQFVLGFDKSKENDHTYEHKGIPIYIQKSEMMFLIGKQIDFHEGSDARGFIFTETDQEDSETEAL